MEFFPEHGGTRTDNRRGKGGEFPHGKALAIPEVSRDAGGRDSVDESAGHDDFIPVLGGRGPSASLGEGSPVPGSVCPDEW